MIATGMDDRLSSHPVDHTRPLSEGSHVVASAQHPPPRAARIGVPVCAWSLFALTVAVFGSALSIDPAVPAVASPVVIERTVRTDRVVVVTARPTPTSTPWPTSTQGPTWVPPTPTPIWGPSMGGEVETR